MWIALSRAAPDDRSPGEDHIVTLATREPHFSDAPYRGEAWLEALRPTRHPCVFVDGDGQPWLVDAPEAGTRIDGEIARAPVPFRPRDRFLFELGAETVITRRRGELLIGPDPGDVDAQLRCRILSGEGCFVVVEAGTVSRNGVALVGRTAIDVGDVLVLDGLRLTFGDSYRALRRTDCAYC